MTHVRRHHPHYRTSGGGHLYQGRFKSFPIQKDQHFLTVCRYVEANALRARLVTQARRCPWCSLCRRHDRFAVMTLTDWPLARPADWLKLVNAALGEPTLQELRTRVSRGRPFGAEPWVRRMAARLGLIFTLRPRGRPRRPPTATRGHRKE